MLCMYWVWWSTCCPGTTRVFPKNVVESGIPSLSIQWYIQLSLLAVLLLLLTQSVTQYTVVYPTVSTCCLTLVTYSIRHSVSSGISYCLYLLSYSCYLLNPSLSIQWYIQLHLLAVLLLLLTQSVTQYPVVYPTVSTCCLTLVTYSISHSVYSGISNCLYLLSYSCYLLNPSLSIQWYIQLSLLAVFLLLLTQSVTQYTVVYPTVSTCCLTLVTYSIRHSVSSGISNCLYLLSYSCYLLNPSLSTQWYIQLSLLAVLLLLLTQSVTQYTVVYPTVSTYCLTLVTYSIRHSVYSGISNCLYLLSYSCYLLNPSLSIQWYIQLPLLAVLLLLLTQSVTQYPVVYPTVSTCCLTLVTYSIRHSVYSGISNCLYLLSYSCYLLNPSLSIQWYIQLSLLAVLLLLLTQSLTQYPVVYPTASTCCLSLVTYSIRHSVYSGISYCLYLLSYSCYLLNPSLSIQWYIQLSLLAVLLLLLTQSVTQYTVVYPTVSTCCLTLVTYSIPHSVSSGISNCLYLLSYSCYLLNPSLSIQWYIQLSLLAVLLLLLTQSVTQYTVVYPTVSTCCLTLVTYSIPHSVSSGISNCLYLLSYSCYLLNPSLSIQWYIQLPLLAVLLLLLTQSVTQSTVVYPTVSTYCLTLVTYSIRHSVYSGVSNCLYLLSYSCYLLNPSLSIQWYIQLSLLAVLLLLLTQSVTQYPVVYPTVSTCCITLVTYSIRHSVYSGISNCLYLLSYSCYLLNPSLSIQWYIQLSLLAVLLLLLTQSVTQYTVVYPTVSTCCLTLVTYSIRHSVYSGISNCLYLLSYSCYLLNPSLSIQWYVQLSLLAVLLLLLTQSVTQYTVVYPTVSTCCITLVTYSIRHSVYSGISNCLYLLSYSCYLLNPSLSIQWYIQLSLLAVLLLLLTQSVTQYTVVYPTVSTCCLTLVTYSIRHSVYSGISNCLYLLSYSCYLLNPSLSIQWYILLSLLAVLLLLLTQSVTQYTVVYPTVSTCCLTLVTYSIRHSVYSGISNCLYLLSYSCYLLNPSLSIQWYIQLSLLAVLLLLLTQSVTQYTVVYPTVSTCCLTLVTYSIRHSVYSGISNCLYLLSYSCYLLNPSLSIQWYIQLSLLAVLLLLLTQSLTQYTVVYPTVSTCCLTLVTYSIRHSVYSGISNCLYLLSYSCYLLNPSLSIQWYILLSLLAVLLLLLTQSVTQYTVVYPTVSTCCLTLVTYSIRHSVYSGISNCLYLLSYSCYLLNPSLSIQWYTQLSLLAVLLLLLTQSVTQYTVVYPTVSTCCLTLVTYSIPHSVYSGIPYCLYLLSYSCYLLNPSLSIQWYIQLSLLAVLLLLLTQSVTQYTVVYPTVSTCCLTLVTYSIRHSVSSGISNCLYLLSYSCYLLNPSLSIQWYIQLSLLAVLLLLLTQSVTQYPVVYPTVSTCCLTLVTYSIRHSVYSGISNCLYLLSYSCYLLNPSLSIQWYIQLPLLAVLLLLLTQSVTQYTVVYPTVSTCCLTLVTYSIRHSVYSGISNCLYLLSYSCYLLNPSLSIQWYIQLSLLAVLLLLLTQSVTQYTVVYPTVSTCCLPLVTYSIRHSVYSGISNCLYLLSYACYLLNPSLSVQWYIQLSLLAVLLLLLTQSVTQCTVVYPTASTCCLTLVTYSIRHSVYSGISNCLYLLSYSCYLLNPSLSIQWYIQLPLLAVLLLLLTQSVTQYTVVYPTVSTCCLTLVTYSIPHSVYSGISNCLYLLSYSCYLLNPSLSIQWYIQLSLLAVLLLLLTQSLTQYTVVYPTASTCCLTLVTYSIPHSVYSGISNCLYLLSYSCYLLNPSLSIQWYIQLSLLAVLLLLLTQSVTQYTVVYPTVSTCCLTLVTYSIRHSVYSGISNCLYLLSYSCYLLNPSLSIQWYIQLSLLAVLLLLLTQSLTQYTVVYPTVSTCCLTLVTYSIRHSVYSGISNCLYLLSYSCYLLNPSLSIQWYIQLSLLAVLLLLLTQSLTQYTVVYPTVSTCCLTLVTYSIRHSVYSGVSYCLYLLSYSCYLLNPSLSIQWYIQLPLLAVLLLLLTQSVTQYTVVYPTVSTCCLTLVTYSIRHSVYSGISNCLYLLSYSCYLLNPSLSIQWYIQLSLLAVLLLLLTQSVTQCTVVYPTVSTCCLTLVTYSIRHSVSSGISNCLYLLSYSCYLLNPSLSIQWYIQLSLLAVLLLLLTQSVTQYPVVYPTVSTCCLTLVTYSIRHSVSSGISNCLYLLSYSCYLLNPSLSIQWYIQLSLLAVLLLLLTQSVTQYTVVYPTVSTCCLTLVTYSIRHSVSSGISNCLYLLSYSCYLLNPSLSIQWYIQLPLLAVLLLLLTQSVTQSTVVYPTVSTCCLTLVTYSIRHSVYSGISNCLYLLSYSCYLLNPSLSIQWYIQLSLLAVLLLLLTQSLTQYTVVYPTASTCCLTLVTYSIRHSVYSGISNCLYLLSYSCYLLNPSLSIQWYIQLPLLAVLLLLLTQSVTQYTVVYPTASTCCLTLVTYSIPHSVYSGISNCLYLLSYSCYLLNPSLSIQWYILLSLLAVLLLLLTQSVTQYTVVYPTVSTCCLTLVTYSIRHSVYSGISNCLYLLSYSCYLLNPSLSIQWYIQLSLLAVLLLLLTQSVTQYTVVYPTVSTCCLTLCYLL